MALFKHVAIISTLITGVLLGVASWKFPGTKISLSILGGDGIGLANFLLLARVVAGFLNRESTGNGRIVALFFFKLLALAALFGIVFALPIDLIGFVAGLSAVVVAITVAGLWANTSTG